MTCPKCDGEIDAFVKTAWGDGVQRQPFAPYLCGWCASLLLVDLKDNQLLDLEDVRRATGQDVAAFMRSNLQLWHTITTERKRILALPNRREVLR